MEKLKILKRSKLFLQTMIATLITVFSVVAIVSATTIGTNITTSGTLTVSSSSTMATTTISGGDLIVDTDTFIVDNDNNRVGIGTTTPAYLLDVDGDLRVGTAGSYNNTLYINTANGRVGIGTSSPYTTLSVAGLSAADYFQANSNISTSTLAGGFSAASSLYVLQNGNVGIGTTLPESKLHVKGGAITVSGTDATAVDIKDGGDFVVSDTSNTHSFNLRNDGSHVLWAGDIPFDWEGFTGYSFVGGNVGIGKTSPAHQLDIAASSATNSTAKTAAYSGINITNVATSTTADIIKSGISISSTGSWTGTNAANIGLYVSSVTGGANNYDAIFNGGGKVGIATSTPSATFSVGSGTATSTMIWECLALE